MNRFITYAVSGWAFMSMAHLPLHAGSRESAVPEGEFASARIATGRGAYAIAAADYRRLVSCYPRDPRAWFGLGHALLAQGDREAAKAAAEQAAKLCRARVQASPNDSSAWLGLTKALAAAGQPEQSNTALGEGLRRNPKNVALLAEKQTRLERAANASLVATREYPLGESEFAELLEKKPKAAKLVLEAHGVSLPPESSAIYFQKGHRLVVCSTGRGHEAVEMLLGQPW